MERKVPVWFVLLCFILWALFTVAFGWAVKSSLSGSDRTGAVGAAAVKVASFPTLVKDVVNQFRGTISGDNLDKSVRVRREADADYSGFAPVRTGPGIEVEGLHLRADPANNARGWRLIVGAFALDGDIENAALLMSPDLEIVKKWVLDEIPVGDATPQLSYRKFVHGLEILKDGSLIFTFDGGISMQRQNSCGERLWATAGDFHHSVNIDSSGETVWSLKADDALAQVDVSDGAVRREITVEEIVAKNPEIDVLELRRVHGNDLGANSRNTSGYWYPDPTHLNDAEPLPARLADEFEGFEADDLLISARSLNLVFVLDPDTLRIKWWRVGQVQRQHDPDWLPSGEIMVFNNRMSRDYSNIVAIDPETFESRTLFDGRKTGFYSRIRGKGQSLPNGGIIVTSPQQGRAFEVDDEGNVVLDLVNLKPGSDDTNYVISEMRWLPLGFFDGGGARCLDGIVAAAK